MDIILNKTFDLSPYLKEEGARYFALPLIEKTKNAMRKYDLSKLDELMNAGISLSEASKYLARKNGIK